MNLSKRTVPHIAQRRQQRALLALTYQSRPLLSAVFPAGPGTRWARRLMPSADSSLASMRQRLLLQQGVQRERPIYRC